MNERARRRAAERARLLGLDRLSLFVPALMSVGLLFWILSELNQLVRSQADDARHRRARAAAAAVVDGVLERVPVAVPGLRARGTYLAVALGLVGVAAYVLIGSILNFSRSDGYVAEVAWLMAIAAAAALVALVYATVALVVFVTYPRPPAWARGVLLRSPLGSPVDVGDDGRPSWELTAFLTVVGFALAWLAALVAWAPEVVDAFNDAVAGAVADGKAIGLGVLLPVSGPWAAASIAVVATVLARRCRVVVATYLGSIVLGLAGCAVIRPIVARAGASGWWSLGRLEAFPSVEVMLLVVFAGLFPVAMAVLTERTWVIRPLRITLAAGVLVTTVELIGRGMLATTALGGLALGLVLVVESQRVLDTRHSHRSCDGCPWSAAPYHGPVLGVVSFHPDSHRVVQFVARVSAALGVTVLIFAALQARLPGQAAGYDLGRGVQVSVGLVLAALMAVGALIAWRWLAPAAVIVAFAAALVGVYASLAYRPEIAVAITVVLLVPAFLLWLSWQHRRRPGEIITVGVVTVMLIAVTATTAYAVHDHFYGPTHPDSVAPALEVDRVRWVWSGDLSATGITVTARVDDDTGSAQLAVESAGGGDRIVTPAVPVERHGLVRFTVGGLQPETAYTYQVIVDGHPDESRGNGRFRTPAEGPYSFRVTAAACARSGSNAAVFDAIRAEDPLLHLALGDMAYENPEGNDPSTLIDLYTRALSTAAQGALAREVPMAYVWDDHDYGPNDADASYPGRSASREAYRLAVPHYQVPDGDAPIYQAFTIGRVRFVITDSRSERTNQTQLGETQLKWLLDELTRASKTHALVVLLSTVPWIAPAQEGSDNWGGQPAERGRIADTIATAGIHNLLMIAGDAHMVAIDDGTNSDYSTGRTDGFPVLHAAALDRFGNVKGGPYSEGTFPGSGQYGVMDVVDDGGDQVRVRLAGRTWTGETLIEREYTFPVPPGL